MFARSRKWRLSRGYWRAWDIKWMKQVATHTCFLINDKTGKGIRRAPSVGLWRMEEASNVMPSS